MTIVTVKNVDYSIDSITFGAKTCNSCGKLCGSARIIKPVKDKSIKLHICYSCSDGHWKKALKIAIAIIASTQKGIN